MAVDSSRLVRLFPVVLIAALVLACGGSQGLEIGQPAPNLDLPDTAGRNLALADLRGQVVLLNFWATWCEPCKEEMPIFQSLLEGYGPAGLAVVLISLGDEPAEVSDYINTHGYTFTALVDSKGITERAYQTNTLPSTFLIDPDGVLRKRWIGPIESAENLAQYLLPLLPGQSSTGPGLSAGRFTPSIPLASLTPTSTPTLLSEPSPTQTPSPTPAPLDPVTPSPTIFPWTATPVPAASNTPVPLSSPSPVPPPTSTPVAVPTSPPPPTATAPPSATPTPKQIAAPVPVSPASGAEFVKGTHAELRWNWNGDLAADEYFDVRVWPEGAPHHGVAWTKERSYQATGQPGIAYYWAIAVIRGQDGQAQAQLSPESEARRLVWIVPTPTPTPTPSPTAAPSYGLSLHCDDPDKTAPAGQLVVIDVILTNTGSVQDTFDCSISEALPGGWQGMFCIGDKCFTSGVHPATVPPGGTQLVEVKIKSAVDARPGEGGNVTLQSSSQGDPSKAASITVRLNVQ